MRRFAYICICICNDCNFFLVVCIQCVIIHHCLHISVHVYATYPVICIWHILQNFVHNLHAHEAHIFVKEFWMHIWRTPHIFTYALHQNKADIWSKTSAINRYLLPGNHDLYNFSHQHLLTCDQLKSSFINDAGISTPLPGTTGYYHFVPVKGYRIVVLDNYEISMLGQPETSDSYRSVYFLFTFTILFIFTCIPI